MNILYFHQHFSTPQGSTGMRSYFLSKNLIKNNHEVTMVCGSYGSSTTGLSNDFKFGKREGRVDGIRVIELNIEYSNNMNFFRRSVSFISYALRCSLIALTEKYDVVVASSTPLTASIPAFFSKLLRRKKFVFEVRDLWPELPKAMGVIKNPITLFLLGILERLSYILADRCVGLSQGISNGIEKKSPQGKPIFTIPNGCDNLFKIVSNEVHEEKIEFNLIYSGTHGIANGLDYLLDISHDLYEADQDIKILLVGDGMKKKSLMQKAKEDNLKNIIFLDPLSKDQLFNLYSRCDIGLQILDNIPAFYHGTSPNKFFDYMTAGLPVINNYPGWIADEISNKKCGFFVNPTKKKSFVDAVLKVKNNPVLHKEMKKNCTLISEKYDRSKLAEKWRKVVTEW